jgi:hypothetical protein
MDNPAIAECRHQLNRLILRDGQDLFELQPWALESDRWAELAFSVLAELSDLPEETLRECVEELAALGLLSVPHLARPQDDKTGVAHRARLSKALEDAGLPTETAAKATEALHDIAAGLQTHFDGHLQRYIRHYGEMMLNDLEGFFDFKTISDAQARNAFCYWMQNALLMPLSNIDGPVRAFCDDLGAKPGDMIEAADSMGVNLGLLDDLALLRWKDCDTKALERLLKVNTSAAETGVEEVA